MYLKKLELVGFKSFARKTVLDFEPGITAIVGPNGCGKSNVSDAIRWVLGEQSAKALRGSKMQDVVFAGTDKLKPMGMAEISLTLGGCEDVLETEFDEVRVTRRVFRSGEGQYFMNKAPCRLKDIQRLFMDTGVGTNSYSVMEQGKIDMILSSRPEDRRMVFEEASGITKFKNDKKEALRKLEHTEANLLRLEDIIREVKRRMVSLQRQAGKARRYKELSARLRMLDLWVSKQRVAELDNKVRLATENLDQVHGEEKTLRQQLEEAEKQENLLREQLNTLDKDISAALEAASEARGQHTRARQSIEVNGERILELKHLSERDQRDRADAENRLNDHQKGLDQIVLRLERAIQERDAAEKQLIEETKQLREVEENTEAVRKTLAQLRSEGLNLESRGAKLQNELNALEAENRNAALRRERLAAEQASLQQAARLHEEHRLEMEELLKGLRAGVEQTREQVTRLEEERAGHRKSISDLAREKSELETALAKKEAQTQMLRESLDTSEDFDGGARWLLGAQEDGAPDTHDRILGSLAQRLQIEPVAQLACETVLRAWLDAVIVPDGQAAIDLLRMLTDRRAGSARLLAVTGPEPSPTPDGAGTPLIDHVQTAEELKPLLARLLSGLRLIENLDQVPAERAYGVSYVTQDGALLRADGSAEFWMQEAGETNPLARQTQLRTWERERDALRAKLSSLQETETRLGEQGQNAAIALGEARNELQAKQQECAQSEGELRMLQREVDQAHKRLETVSFELESLMKQKGSETERVQGIHKELEEVRTRQSDVRSQSAKDADQLRDLEAVRGKAHSEVADKRVAFSERRQACEHMEQTQQATEARIKEISSLIKERAEGVGSYQKRIDEITAATEDLKSQLDPLQKKATEATQLLDTSRSAQEKRRKELAEAEEERTRRRERLDSVLEKKSALDVEAAEQRVRRQNLLDRVTGEYRITADDLLIADEPEWDAEKGRPAQEELEINIAELRAKIEGMGAVNLVAIEELEELEERHAFLTQQQDDLVKGKEQLLEMIDHINKTTTELFSETFNKVNEAFQEMFKVLFNGGTAKLVLENEENVLESGIEIIARPPGKKLQSVSLLSGGERTMTAVALLFSLYQVKPSPFCVLDELDAALDDSNIGRFVEVVKGFKNDSQFIIITHSRQTIAAADVLYGVTMQDRGVSGIVSVKFSEYEKELVETGAP